MPKYTNGEKVVITHDTGCLKVGTVTTVVSWDGYDDDYQQHTYGVIDDPTTWYLESELKPYVNGVRRATTRAIQKV